MSRWFYLVFMAFIAVGISLLIIPSEEEFALLHLNDNKFETAEEIYEKEVKEEEDPDQRTVFPLVKLYLKNGETEKAVIVLNRLIKDEPKNIEAHRYLAKVHKDTQNRHEYMKSLDVVNKLEPDPKITRELVNYHSFIKNENKEIKNLRLLLDREQASQSEITKLAKLYVADKKIDEAVKVLVKVLPKIGATSQYDNLYLLLSLLISDKNLLKAKHVAEDFVSTKHTRASIDVIRYVYLQGEQELAYKLAAPLIKKVPFDIHLIEWQVEYYIARKESKKAIAILHKLAEKKQLPTKLEGDLISLAMLTKDPKILSQSLRVVQLKAVAHKELLYLAEFLIDKKLSQEAHYVRLKLGQEFLDKTPLLDTLLLAADTNASSVNRTEKLKNVKNLKPKDRLRLAQVFHFSKSDDLAKTVLSKDFSFQDVTEENVIGVCDTLVALGMEKKSLQMLTKKYKDIYKAPKNYQKAWALLATASGLESKVISWYKKNKSVELKFFERLFGISTTKKLNKLTEQLALHLHREENTEKSKIRLVDSYMTNESFVKAEPILKELAYTKAGAWEHDYVAVLTKLKKEKELNKYWKSKADSDGLDTKKKREIGYMLFKAGDKAGAEKIFLELSKGKGPGNPDVEQLITIYGGNRLNSKGLRWVETRLRQAGLNQKKTWLKKILYSGHSRRVIGLIDEMNLSHKDGFTNMYIEALERVKDRKGLQRVIGQEIDRKSDVKVLIKLAGLAVYAKSKSLERKAYNKLAGIAPNHPFVLKRSATIAMSRKQYGKALSQLDKLFATGQEDVRSLYNYAEIIRRQQGIEKARTYYEKTLNKVRNSKGKNVEFNVIEAKSLYFVGKKPESISKHRKILAQNKNNKTLKADIAHFFMDVGELKEAEAALNG